MGQADPVYGIKFPNKIRKKGDLKLLRPPLFVNLLAAFIKLLCVKIYSVIGGLFALLDDHQEILTNNWRTAKFGEQPPMEFEHQKIAIGNLT